jgi:invasion protein IalB
MTIRRRDRGKGRYGGAHLVLAVLCAGLYAVPSQGVPRDGETFEAWTARCEREDPNHEQCYIFQNLVLKDSNQRVLHIAIGYVDSDAPIILLTLPLGISLPPGARIEVDTGETSEIAIERCETNGCRAGLKVGQRLFDALRKGMEAKIVFHDAQRRPISVPVSLKGLYAGLTALKK